MEKKIELFRRDYSSNKLTEKEIPENPFVLFDVWIQQAIKSGITDANATVLSTVSGDGKPSSRVVLLRGYNENGFVFYTNYKSDKGKHIDGNFFAALNFYWPNPERQIRVRGKAVIVSAEISDKYFESRPRESQLGAWASEQSKPVKSRKEIAERLRFFRNKFKGKKVPRPSFWGGYVVQPSEIEFWQGRKGRLHDRFLYTLLPSEVWSVTRLSP
jgi:pyridoxamine 5'-phosphate oxidase